jgi:lactate dehydrogenase-like 2-hydroxyacid dehydrogenase
MSASPPPVLSIAVGGLHEKLTAAGLQPVAWPADEAQRQALLAVAPEIVGVVTAGPAPLPAGFLEAAQNLKIIACIGAGFDHYDPDALRARGVALTNAAGVNAQDVAELAFGLLLAAQRRIVAADGFVRAGEWRRLGLTQRLRERKLGIIGLGAIGQAVGVRAAAFQMTVGWTGPRVKPSDWRYFAEPMELAAWSDAVVVCARPAPENRHLVGAEFLEALGPGGLLVNVARGSLVDEPALAAALRSGQIAAAALDVFEKEPPDPDAWKDVPNLILHPHSGGATIEALEEGCDLAVRNVRLHLAGEPLISAVN